MFDDRDTAESRTETPDTQPRSSWWIGRWAHVIAGVTFCFLYFALADHAWSWQVAITVAYIVFVLCCTCGLAFKDSDDLLGSSEVQGYLAKLLVRQTAVLALVSLGLYLWRYAIPMLPLWLTARGRRLSLWDYSGIILTYFVAVKEASWIAARIKLKYPETEDSV